MNYFFAQEIRLCGTDKVMKEHRKTDFFKMNQKIINNNHNVEGGPKVIPIVFHIIHNGHAIGEEENISVEQINDAVNILNEDYNMLNNDLENVVSTFTNIVGDADVVFKLAKLDPNGDCTTGINRIFSDMTNQANDCIKELIAWDDSKYVNIWVVEDIDSNIGAAAYTYLPGTLWFDVEGIIINHEYVGSVGTSNNTPYKRHTLSHEFGHYFNLEHTWGWGSNGALENCESDDGVDDTPNTIGAYSTCNLSQESCGGLDNIQNFMDYSSCTCMFTEGQVEKMNNCLNSSVSNRDNLWQNDNLWETGTHDNYIDSECLPNVDFFVSITDRICNNTTISFTNTTTTMDENVSFMWDLPGTDLGFSSVENPSVTYLNPGTYDVTLTVTNSFGESTKTKTYDVYVSETDLMESFENINFPNNTSANLEWTIQSPEDEISWTRSPISSTTSSGSVRIRSRYFDCYQKHYLYTPNLDLTNFSLGMGEPLKIWFDLAYGKRNNQTDDLLKISYSKDCGETWQIRAEWDTEELITTNDGNVGNNFIPNSTEWMEKSVNIQSAAGQNDVIIRFEFEGDRGSYLYIDNVRLTGDWITLDESPDNEKVLIKTLDLLGRERKNSKLYFEIYNNGSVEKFYNIK